MDIHQCMTCGERWGHGTVAAGKRVELHRNQGHTVLVGDDAVFDRQANAQGLEIVRPAEEPIVLYRCFDCHEFWMHGTEEEYLKGTEHTALGHLVLVGEDPAIKTMSRELVSAAPQAPNPTDPDSKPGGGSMHLWGEAERT